MPMFALISDRLVGRRGGLLPHHYAVSVYETDEVDKLQKILDPMIPRKSAACRPKGLKHLNSDPLGLRSFLTPSTSYQEQDMISAFTCKRTATRKSGQIPARVHVRSFAAPYLITNDQRPQHRAPAALPAVSWSRRSPFPAR